MTAHGLCQAAALSMLGMQSTALPDCAKALPLVPAALCAASVCPGQAVMHHKMYGIQEGNNGYLFIVPDCELVSIAGGDLQGVEALYSHMQSAGLLHACSASDA